MSYERHIRLNGAFNVRDLGGYAAARGKSTRWRSLLRSDALHELSPEDIDTLLQLGLRTVIDLRSQDEIAKEPSPFEHHPDVRFHHIPLFDGLAPVEAMMKEKGALDLSARYVAAADCCRPAIAKVASAIALAEKGAVLFNCTAGKDRTGIIAAMLLSLAGVDREEIAGDYALTQTLAPDLLDRLRARAMEKGLAEDAIRQLLSSEPATILALLSHIGDQYGGFQDYIIGGQLDREHIALIEERMLT